MNKAFITSFVFLFLFQISSLTGPDQPYNNVGKNYFREPAAKADCLDLAKGFFTEARAQLSIPKASLFGKYPDVLAKMEQLEFIPLRLNDFFNDFVKLHNRPPTLREGMEHIYSLRREIIKNYDDVIVDLESMHEPALEAFIKELIFSRNKLNKFKDLDAYQDELENAVSLGRSKLTSLDEPMVMKNGAIENRYSNYLKDRSREGNFNGELGELLAYGASKDPALQKGLKFETRQLIDPTPYQEVIRNALAKLEEVLHKKSDKQLLGLVSKYGDGLLRGAHDYLEGLDGAPFDREVLINKVLTMIRTKEIDLVFQGKNGHVIWAEVKTYKKPIDLETLNGGGYKAKPMAEQLLEHKALRDVLGLKTAVDLRFISPTSEVTPEARAQIESLGYEVISAK